MATDFLILAAVLLLGFSALLYFLNQKLEGLKKDEATEVLMGWLKEMRGSLDKNTEVVSQRLQESNRTVNERLDKAAEVIGGVQKELGHMSEIGRRMEELQDFLKSPKLRGNLGEQVLEDLLAQSLPQEKFTRQYAFRDRQIVDYVIKTASGLIPIDSKFPLENFRLLAESKDEMASEQLTRAFVRDVKKHIADVADKYIRPQEGTTEFAIMYIPSESIAYEILVNHPDLCDFAQAKRVGIVSPNQFNHFLKVIMIGFERQQVQEQAKEILAALRTIRSETDKFGGELRVMIKHITDAHNKAAEVELRFDRLLGGIERVDQLEDRESATLPSRLAAETGPSSQPNLGPFPEGDLTGRG